MQPVPNRFDVPVGLITGPGVSIEAKALSQALALCELAPTLASVGASLDAVVLTPDLHLGPQLPVGVVFDVRGGVIPGAIGSDVGCGMRMAVFDDVSDLTDRELALLSGRLRAVFFEGARDLPLRPEDRLAVLEYGLIALLDAPHVTAGAGLWSLLGNDLADHIERTHAAGGLDAGGVDDAMAIWGRRSGERDSQLGSLGGGNHFCELQRVEEVCEGPTAWMWGLKAGALAVMVHAGSLGFGHVAHANGARDARAEWSAGWTLPHRLMPITHAHAQRRYIRAMRNAANFAWANRLALILMAVGAVRDVVGAPPRSLTVGDSPHNLISREEDRWRHRKGACPANGADGGGVFGNTGHPVLIPGSMGDASWVLAGSGATETLSSSCHGAGRLLSRGAASCTRDDDADSRLRVVTPVDPMSLANRGRRDLLGARAKRLREEAPRAYKAVGPVVDAVEAAGAARKVARTRPLLTVKG